MNTHQNPTASEPSNSVAGNDKQSQLTLGLLQAIEQKDNISQRHLAQEMGVALGLANSSLKRCVKKGWIKITTAPANRYLYYLTPNGFAEKARLTADFFSTSLALFRQSGDEYSSVFDHCVSVGSTRVVLAGLSDLTEIAVMRAMQSKIELVAIYQPGSQRTEFFGVPIVVQSIECDSFDAIVLTSMEQTRELALELEDLYGAEKLVVPAMLLNMNYRNPLMSEQDSNLA